MCWCAVKKLLTHPPDFVLPSSATGLLLEGALLPSAGCMIPVPVFSTNVICFSTLQLMCFGLSVCAGYASQHIWCLSQARRKWEGCSRKGIRCKNEGNDGGGLLISPDGVASIRIVGVSASDIFPCTIKSRKRFLLAPAHPGSPGKRVIRRLCDLSVFAFSKRAKKVTFQSCSKHDATGQP